MAPVLSVVLPLRHAHGLPNYPSLSYIGGAWGTHEGAGQSQDKLSRIVGLHASPPSNDKDLSIHRYT